MTLQVALLVENREWKKLVGILAEDILMRVNLLGFSMLPVHQITRTGLTDFYRRPPKDYPCLDEVLEHLEQVFSSP